MGLLRATATGNSYPNASNTGAVLPAATYNTVILADTPKGFWDWNGTDLTGNGNTATRYGSPTTTVLPNGDLAMTFANSASPPSPAQYAEIPTQNYFSPAAPAHGGATGILTIEAWIAPAVTTFANEAGTGDSAYVWWAGKGTASGSSGNQEWGCRMYGLDNTQGRYNRTSGYCYNPAGGLGDGAYFQVPAAGPVAVNVFVHYVLVINTQNTSSAYPQGYVTIYRDGVNTNKQSLQSPPGTTNVTPVYGPPGVTPAPVRIGTRNFESYFEGAAGKFALYDYELTAAQVSSHYNAMLKFPGSLFTVASGVATSAADAVAAGYTGNANWTYTGSAWTFSGGSPVLSSLNVGTQGITVNASNTTVTGCQVAGQIVVGYSASVSNTLIYNSVVAQAAGGAGQAIKLGGGPSYTWDNTTIQNCTLSGTDAATNRLAYGIIDAYGNGVGANLVIQGCDIYWCRTGMQLTAGLVTGNYVHDMGYLSGDHTDCIISLGQNTASSFADGLTITGNTLFNNLTQTSSIDLGSTDSTINYVTVSGNLMAGGGYSIYGGDTSGATTRHDNGDGTSPSSGSYTVTDTAAAVSSADIGATITCTTAGIFAANTHIAGVSGSTYTLSQATTGAGSGLNFYVQQSYGNRTDPGCGSANSVTVTDPSAVAGDLGATVTNTTTPSSIPAGTTISAVTAGTGYTLSAATTGGTLTGQTFVIHFTNNVVVTGNRFSQAYYTTVGQFGQVSDYDTAVASNAWTDNAIHDTGAPVSA